MKNDLVPELSTSGGNENIVTAMDAFSRYFFAYATASQDAKTIAKVINNIMTKHACLPTTITSDKYTAFLSHAIKEVAGVLGITPKHATTKHAQTIGLLKRSHASIKQTWRLKQVTEDHCGIKTSVVRTLIITLLITQILAASPAEIFMAVFLIIC